MPVNIGMNREPIKYPSQVLQEDGEAVQTTASVATTDLPVGKKVLRRQEPAIPERVDEKKMGDGKPRHCLPQITDWDGFVAAVEEQGGEIQDERADPGSLTPTQSNFNPEKVARIVEGGKDDLLKAKPIVVSADDFILDGHHRWLAAKELLDDEMPVRRVSLTIEDLHDLCKDAEFVERKKLDENMNQE